MAKPTGFMEFARQNPPKRPVSERVADYDEVAELMSQADLENQAARCMDCGVPFCHTLGCPLGNVVPEWNDMIYRGHWDIALDILHLTNALPEITGRVCPALCEAACTLSINADPVSICQIELQIAERGWREGWIRPEPPELSTGKRVAIVGSGPAGLTAAQLLARAGQDVTVYEKSERIGGLLRYGIPDFKLEKWVIDRRLEQMRAEGIVFEPGVAIGCDISGRLLMRKHDAVVLCIGAEVPRDLDVPGRDANGVHFALDFLTQQNRINSGEGIGDAARISAEGKHVVVIGGGDTGSDCVGTSRRQGAASITQIELLPKPPEGRSPGNPWPEWPLMLRTSTSHEEGCERLWSIATKHILTDDQGRVRALSCVKLDWTQPEDGTRPMFAERPDSEFEIQADLVLLAMGFLHATHGELVKDLELELDARGNILVDDDCATSHPGVFAAGDAMSGASLVVRAMARACRAAESVNCYLTVG